jgi:hypothetical protein
MEAISDSRLMGGAQVGGELAPGRIRVDREHLLDALQRAHLHRQQPDRVQPVHADRPPPGGAAGVDEAAHSQGALAAAGRGDGPRHTDQVGLVAGSVVGPVRMPPAAAMLATSRTNMASSALIRRMEESASFG